VTVNEVPRITAESTGRAKTNVALLSVASNTVLIILKLAVGLLIGSVAVISEAIHSGVDLLAALIALFAVRKSSAAADERHPYGHGKYENISGTIEALLIFAAAIWIIYEAVRRLLDPQEIDMPGWGVAVMGLSAVVNIFVSRRLFKVGRATDSVALQADGWHLRTDVYTSIGVMVGLLVIWVGGYLWPGIDLHWIDSVVAIAVALLISKTAFDLTREAARDLLDVSLPQKDVEWIPGFVMSNWPEVKSFHNLRTRKAGSTRFIDFHLAVDDHMSVGEAHELGDRIVVAIKQRMPDTRVYIHVEPCDYGCPTTCESGCSVEPEARHRKEASP
jgi:cation diffusion facilitator family transporter